MQRQKGEDMDGVSPTSEPVVGQQTEVWASIVEACRQVDDPMWERPTDCPGWSVKDQLSHLIGIERMLLGEPAPPPLGADDLPPHVTNEIGAMNESWVAARRSVPGSEVLAEFVDTTNRRIDALLAMSTEAFDVVGWTPVGEAPYRVLIESRILDSWAHEQDIRRALDRPGGRNGAGEAAVLDRCARTMPYVIGKQVAPPDGTSVLLAVTGVLGRHIPVVVEGGRARLELSAGVEPTVTLTMDQTTFWRLCFGRVDPLRVQATGEVTVTGAVSLAEQVLGSMAFMR
jgi:uncharacterized protein (TIGR03083 family)